MTQEDILSCGRFDDAVAVASYPLDIHHPQGGGCTLEWCGDCYDIPYRSLVPLKVDNLLVAGRSISTTHEAKIFLREKRFPKLVRNRRKAGRQPSPPLS